MTPSSATATLALCALLSGAISSQAFAQTLAPQHAALELDYLSRDMAYYTTERFEVTMELEVAAGRASLHVRGHYESRGAELTPGGPTNARRYEAELDETWTGTARRDGAAWIIHFDRTTHTRPPTDPDFDWRCERVSESVAGAPRRVLRCATVRDVPWRSSPGRPVSAYFRVPLRFDTTAIQNEVHGSYGHPTNVTLR